MTDSLVVISDAQKRALAVFARDSADFIRQISLTASPIYSLAPSGHDVWFGALDMAAGTGIGLWNSKSDELTYGLQLPDSYLESRWNAIYGIYPTVNVLPLSRDTLLVGFMPTDYLLLVAASSLDATDTVGIPVLRRRGAGADLGQRFESGELSYPEMVSAASALFFLHSLSDRTVLAVHYDVEISDGGYMPRVWFTLIGPDLSAACVDNAVQFDTDIQPVMAFRGDTIHVLTQRVVGDTAETLLTKYTADATGCSWTPINARSPTR